MRLLLFADLHLDAQFAWADRAVARARRRALRLCLTRITELAASLRVDAVCCAGDLYEQERFTPDTMALLRESFAALHPTPVLVAPGNHDWFGPASLYRHVRWTDNVHVFTEPVLRRHELADGLTVWGAAHCAPARTPGFLSDFRVEGSGVHIGLFHGSEQRDLAQQSDGTAPHAPFRATQVPEAGLNHALVGHFHTPRDGPHHTYPGNPEPLTFGERGDRGAVLVTIDERGQITRQRYRVSVSTVSDVAVDLAGVTNSAQLRERVAAGLADRAGTVRATLHGDIAPAVDIDLGDLASVAPHLEALVVRLGEVHIDDDLELIALEQTVRGQFVRDVQTADLDERLRHRVLVTGLRALDGRADLEVR